MRIWDIDPGFLNDKSLLGEHMELHGIVSIIENEKKGYSCHPETIRWKTRLESLSIRHDLLVCEMTLRGFNHRSFLPDISREKNWPDTFIDPPHDQFQILQEKYMSRKQGRIPLPRNCQELWSYHKYSVMARDPGLYKKTGKQVAENHLSFDALCLLLVQTLRSAPKPGRLYNAVDHMWGYVSKYSHMKRSGSDWENVLKELKEQSFRHTISYLLHSTALGELNFWFQHSRQFN